MRSALTTLGILIGVAAVIILVAVGTGSSVAVQESISRLGTNTLTVSASQGGTGGRGGGGLLPRRRRGRPAGPAVAAVPARRTVDTGTQTRVAQLTLADAQALTDRSQAPHVVSVAPVVNAQSVVATYAGATHTVSTFVGSTPSYLVNDNDTVRSGSPFTDSDYTQHRRVALLGRERRGGPRRRRRARRRREDRAVQRNRLHRARDPRRRRAAPGRSTATTA